MNRTARLSLLLLACGLVLAAAAPAFGQISKTGTTNLQWAPRYDSAYDTVNDVYLLVAEGPPVRGQFVDRNGAPIGGVFNISLETPLGSEDPYTAWSTVSFGGTPADPTFLVTYLAIEGSNVPKYGRLVRFRPGQTPTVSNRTQISPNIANEWYAADRSRTIWYGQSFIVSTRVNSGGKVQPRLHYFSLTGQLTGGLLLGDGLDYEGGPSLACAPTGVCMATGFAGGNPFGGTGGIWARLFDPNTLLPLSSVFYLDDHSSPVDVPWVVYASHMNKFVTAWYRRTGGAIDFRLTNTNGSLGPFDKSKSFGGGTAGEPQLVYNPISRTSLLLTKYTSGASLYGVEIGDDGYPKPSVPPIQVTAWDGLVLEYRPTLVTSNREARWIATYILAAGGRAALIQGTASAVTSVAASPTNLAFSVSKTGSTIIGATPQTETVTFSGGAGGGWSAASSVPWLQVTGGSGSGNGQFSVTVINPSDVIGTQTSLNGSVVLTAPGTSNSPLTIPVTLTVVPITPVGAPPQQLNLDGDDAGDVFAYKPSTGAWAGLSTQAGGGFAASNGAWLPNWTVAAAHFDANPLTDFFLFNTTTGAWSKMLNNGTGFTTQASGAWWPGWQRFVMDLNGDGVSDVFLYDPVSGQWYKCFSTPTGFTYANGSWTPGWEVYPMTLNGDAYADMFLFDRTHGGWYWVLGNNGNAFTYPVSQTWHPSWTLYPGDFNGDGLTDMLLHYAPNGLYFVATTTAAGFSYEAGGGWPGGLPVVADLNGDGAEDLFLHIQQTGQWNQMISNGAGQFAHVLSGAWSPGWDVYPTDLNGDGRTDFLLYNPLTGAWYQARNLAAGFTYSSGFSDTGLTIVVRAPIR